MNNISRIFLTASALLLAGSVSFAQNSSTAWPETIERALRGHGINSVAKSDIQNGAETLHLTIDGKTVAEPVVSSGARVDYSSPVYVIVDGIESRSTYLYPVIGDVVSSIRSAISSGRKNQVESRANSNRKPYSSYDPQKVWHSRSTIYIPEDVYEDPRDLDLLEIALENGVGSAVRTKLVDPVYARNVPADQTLLLLRTRVIDLQRGTIYEKPKEGAPANEPLKVSRWLAYFSVNVQLVDDMTGQIVWQGTFSDDYNTMSRYTDPMEEALEYLSRKISQALNKMYPSSAPREGFEGLVSAIESEKKEKAQTVYINMGHDQELREGDGLVIYLQQTIAGNTGITQIGTAVVSEVRGPSLSLCKVKKGEKEVYSALKEGQILVVKTDW